MDFKTPRFSDLMKWYCLTFRIKWDAWCIYKYLCLTNGGLHLFNKIGRFLVISKVKIQGNGLSLHSTTSEQELEFVNSWTRYHRGNRDLEGRCTHRMNSTTNLAKGTDSLSKSWTQQGGDFSQHHTRKGRAAQTRILAAVLWIRDRIPGPG